MGNSNNINIPDGLKPLFAEIEGLVSKGDRTSAMFLFYFVINDERKKAFSRSGRICREMEHDLIFDLSAALAPILDSIFAENKEKLKCLICDVFTSRMNEQKETIDKLVEKLVDDNHRHLIGHKQYFLQNSMTLLSAYYARTSKKIASEQVDFVNFESKYRSLRKAFSSTRSERKLNPMEVTMSMINVIGKQFSKA